MTTLRQKNEALVYNILPSHVAKDFIGRTLRDEVCRKTALTGNQIWPIVESSVFTVRTRLVLDKRSEQIYPMTSKIDLYFENSCIFYDNKLYIAYHQDRQNV